MSEIKIKNKLANLKKALDSLGAVCSKPLDNEKIIIDATVQRFEFSYELFWKTLKVLLEKEGMEATTPKNILQEAYRFHWITDEKIWLMMLKDRNITSHVYNEKEAVAIYERIKTYYPEMKTVYEKLVEKFKV